MQHPCHIKRTAFYKPSAHSPVLAFFSIPLSVIFLLSIGRGSVDTYIPSVSKHSFLLVLDGWNRYEFLH